jgi:AcrR family transcriptional regulator
MRDNDHFDDEVFKSLPNGVKLSWGLGKQPKRGPKGELSIPKIVDAAIAIADKDGLSAVSMNRVAGSLGFTTMSLYRYISSKEDLLQLMHDAACEIPIPPEKNESDWREDLREYVKACIEVFCIHPWFGDIPITGIPLGPNNLLIIDWALRALRHFPLNDYEKMSIILLLSSYSRSSGMIKRDIERAIREGASKDAVSGVHYSAALKQLVIPDLYPHLHPIIQSGTYTEDNADENTVGNDFDFGLERILDGIEHYLVTKTSGK